MSRYRKIEVRTWGDEKFRSLSAIPACGQGLWFYLLTGPHTGPIPGLFRSGRAALAEELGWDLTAFDEAFRELSDLGMVKADFAARLIWIPKALKHNRPESPNVVRSWSAEFDLLPECQLKRDAFESMRTFICSMSEGFDKAFREAFAKLLPKEFCDPDPKSKPKTKPNQEQEQEQEQDKNAALDGRGRDEINRIETLCREAAGFENNPSPSLCDLSPILGLIDAGFDLDGEILPVIRAKRKPGVRSWSFFVAAVHDSRATRVAAATTTGRPPSTAGPRPSSNATVRAAERLILELEADAEPGRPHG